MTQPDRTQPDPSRADLPWAVVGVLGDDTGVGFSYSNGLLSLYQHPELWMSARSVGGYPAVELCTMHLAYYVNNFACNVRDGLDLVPGDHLTTVERWGPVQLAVTVGEPVTAVAVGALAIHPDVLVLPIEWSARWLEPRSRPRRAGRVLRCPCPTQTCGYCEQHCRELGCGS